MFSTDFIRVNTYSKDSVSNFTVVLPVYNENERIDSSLSFYTTICKKILLVDNYSSDDTLTAASQYTNLIKIVQIKNNGTIETPEWFQQIKSYIDTDYIFLASCSERVSSKLLFLMDYLALTGSVNFVVSERKSLTGGYPSDNLYCKPQSLFSLKVYLPTVIRFLNISKLNLSKVYPHDSFKSQDQMSSVFITSPCDCYKIIHYRPYPSLQSLAKMQAYATQYAKYKLKFSPPKAILDSTLRIILDTMRIIRSIALLSCGQIIFVEFLLRVYLHLYTVYVSFRFKLVK